VVEPADDWSDLTYVLCNKLHSQFCSEKGDITGKKLLSLKGMDLEAAGEFLALCKGNLPCVNLF
jgi:hypothetical protein